MHMDSILKSGAPVIPVRSYHTDFLEIPMYRAGGDRKAELSGDLLGSTAAFLAQFDDGLLLISGENPDDAPGTGTLSSHATDGQYTAMVG